MAESLMLVEMSPAEGTHVVTYIAMTGFAEVGIGIKRTTAVRTRCHLQHGTARGTEHGFRIVDGAALRAPDCLSRIGCLRVGLLGKTFFPLLRPQGSLGLAKSRCLSQFVVHNSSTRILGSAKVQLIFHTAKHSPLKK
jgi:hypothetical protein